MLKTLLASALTAMITLSTPTANAQNTATTLLAGGCFWCLQHDMQVLPGVISAVSGYAGGTAENPTYENYHDGPNPHIEVVQVTYDTSKLTFAKLLDEYFRNIDPTDDGGQFCDRGESYAPFVFVNNAEERELAEAKKAEVAAKLKAEVKVRIRDAARFWPAEDYHQDYASKNRVRYKFYRASCGRDARIDKLWKNENGGK